VTCLALISRILPRRSVNATSSKRPCT